jgi:oxygen-dependent protoporphyrinogen oxidase
LSPGGKLRVVLEQAVRARSNTGDESLGSFMRRHFGAEAYDRMIEPLMSGIYGGNGDALSLLATFPQLRRLEIEHGSVLRGIKRSSPPGQGSRRPSPFVAPTGGMEVFPQAVRSSLSAATVESGAAVMSLERGKTYRLETSGGRELHAHAVILATPSHAAANLVAGVDARLAHLLEGISYGSTATVSLGFVPGSLPIEKLGHGYIIPRREGRPLMAVTFSSRKFRDRAPSGALLARAFIRAGGKGSLTSRTDDELIGLVREELRRTHGIVAEPEACWVFRLPSSMPQYAVGHPERVAQIERCLAELPGLYLAGAAYRGVGIPDCIASGEAAAGRAAAFLSERSSGPGQ